MNIHKIKLILVQICEAHTNKWPLGMSTHPEQHKNFEERIKRANEFNMLYPYFEVYIDTFDNKFENIYRAWPDKYVVINKERTIIGKSEYSFDALVIYDYAKLINDLIEKTN
jgi:hypothetical protein